MGQPREVLVFPADKSRTGRFLLAVTRPSGDNFAGWATEDSSFTEGELATEEEYEAVGFRTAEEAIAWAKSAPRYWRVVNELMFSRKPLAMPRRFTVSVTKADYAPWYVTHPTIQRRQEAGEQVRQVEIKIEALDVMTQIGGCYVLIDSEALGLLNTAGIRSPAEMVGQILVLDSEDTADPTRPLRIRRVVKK